MNDSNVTKQNVFRVDYRSGVAMDPASFHNNINNQIILAIDKVRNVQSQLLRKNAAAEIRNLFTQLLTFITPNQLELDDRYFLRGLAKLELVGILLSEKRFTSESAIITECCSLLRTAYVDNQLHHGVPLEGNKVCMEFSQIDSKSPILDDLSFKRINSIFLAVALTGKNYFFSGFESGIAEELESSASIEDHAKFVRNSYYRLNFVKQGLIKLAKSDRTDSELYWKGVLSLLPATTPPILLDYQKSSTEPRSGLVGIEIFAKDIAGIVMCSEIFRTHPSGMFKVLAATLSSLAGTLMAALGSYCDKIGGSSLNREVTLASAQELKTRLRLPFERELANVYNKISMNPEFMPQSESMAFGIQEQKQLLAA